MKFLSLIEMQGSDSSGNDVVRRTDVSTATGLKETVTKLYRNDNSITAFNSNGWIKNKVVYPLANTPVYSAPLSGIFIRTFFSDYAFFPNVDSPGNDIKQTPADKDNVPALIRTSNAILNSAGFNTNGWHKFLINLPPPKTAPSLAQPWQGTYVRHSWPGFVFLPGLDSPGNDIRKLENKQTYELVREGCNEPTAVAFNTDGQLKKDLVVVPTDFPGADLLKGIYIKIPPGVDTDGSANLTQSQLNAVLFALYGSAILWTQWIFDSGYDFGVAYQGAIGKLVAEFRNNVASGTLMIEKAALQAFGLRNLFLLDLKASNSPPGQLLTHAIKPAGYHFPQIADIYASKQSGAPKFKDLQPAVVNQVCLRIPL